jgi:hypothetical protein
MNMPTLTRFRVAVAGLHAGNLAVGEPVSRLVAASARCAAVAPLGPRFNGARLVCKVNNSALVPNRK